MARLIVGLLELALVLWLVSSPLAGHHSFGAEYDTNKPVVLTGVVTKIEWTNPHSHFYLAVKDDKGRVSNWILEGYTVNALYRTGWKKDVSMKVGDRVTVTGWRARDGGTAAPAR